MSKRQGAEPTQSNTMLNYLSPKKPKVKEEADPTKKPEEPQEPEKSKPAPKPGPSTAASVSSVSSTESLEVAYRPIYKPPPEDDFSSQYSSSTQSLGLGQTGSVEEMDVDDPDLMTVDSSSSVERDSEYRLDWTGSRM